MFYRKTDVEKPTKSTNTVKLIDVEPSDNVFIIIDDKKYRIINTNKHKNGNINTNSYQLLYEDKYQYIMHIAHGVLYLFNCLSNFVVGYDVNTHTNLFKQSGFYYVINTLTQERGKINGNPLSVGDYVNSRFVVTFIEDNYILLHSKSGMPKVINKYNTTSECVYIDKSQMNNYIINT